MEEKNLEYHSISVSLKQLAIISASRFINSDEHQDKSNAEKIILLDRMGFEHNEIALIVNTTSGTVAKELSISRKKAK